MEAKGLKEALSRKINGFFEIHLGSTDVITVWEVFKDYIRGGLISQGAFRKKLREQVRSDMVLHILELQQEHKMTGDPVVWNALITEMDKLKLLNAQAATREIMYAKQWWFEFKDKPGQLLAHLLADVTQH